MIRTTLLCLCIASSLPAQHGPGWRGGRTMGMRQGPILTQLYSMRVERIQQSLGVSAEQARIMADRWSRFDRDFLAKNRQARLLRAQINDIVVGPGGDPEKNTLLRPLIHQYTVLRREQHDLRDDFERDLLNGLTPLQQGRLVFLVDDIQRSLRQALADSR
nr:hypothetical protein [uncultured Holophaga sp.]